MAEQRCRNIVPGLEFVGILGRGCFGVVYLVKNEDGEQFAVKHIDLDGRTSKNENCDPEKERDLLRALSHEHVLMYVDSHVIDGSLYVITEYCQGGDMERFLANSGRPVPEDLLTCWLYQMARGLEYMHTHDPVVLHRDLKPGNIYLTGAGDIRLGDLGIARELEQESDLATTVCGTPSYMSPELLLYKPYTAKTDIWSLGCCAVVMATLKKAFDESSLYKIICAIVHNDRKPLPATYSRNFDHLVGQMLQKDPQHRPSASQICACLQHKQFWPIDKRPYDLLVSHDLLKVLRQPPNLQQLREDEVRTKYFSLTQSFSVVRKIMMDETDGFHDRMRARRRGGAGSGNRSMQSTRKSPTAWQDETDRTLLSLSSLSTEETFLDHGTTESLGQEHAMTPSAREPEGGYTLCEDTFVDHGTDFISTRNSETSAPVSLSMVWLDRTHGETKSGRQDSTTLSAALPASLSMMRGQAFTGHDTTKKSSEMTLLSLSKSSDATSNTGATGPALHPKMTSDEARSRGAAEGVQNKTMPSTTKSFLSVPSGGPSDHGMTKPTQHQTIKLSMESSPLMSSDEILYQITPKPAQHRTIQLSMKSPMGTSGHTLDFPSTTKSAHRTVKLTKKSSFSTSSDETLDQATKNPTQHRTIKISVKSPLSNLSDETSDRCTTKPTQYQTITLSTKSSLLNSSDEPSHQSSATPIQSQSSQSSTIARFSLSTLPSKTSGPHCAKPVQFHHITETSLTTRPARTDQTAIPPRESSLPLTRKLVDHASVKLPQHQIIISPTPETSKTSSLLNILVSTVTSSVLSPDSEQTQEAEQLKYGTRDCLGQQMEQLKKSLEHALCHTSRALDISAILDLLTASQNPYTALTKLKTMLDDR